MPEIGTSSSMSGDRKRGVGHRPQATAPILDSTDSEVAECPDDFRFLKYSGLVVLTLSFVGHDRERTCTIFAALLRIGNTGTHIDLFFRSYCVSPGRHHS
jgi:hypothetical protein